MSITRREQWLGQQVTTLEGRIATLQAEVGRERVQNRLWARAAQAAVATPADTRELKKLLRSYGCEVKDAS